MRRAGLRKKAKKCLRFLLENMRQDTTAGGKKKGKNLILRFFQGFCRLFGGFIEELLIIDIRKPSYRRL